MNPLLDAIGSLLSGAGYVLDTPGALLRGALAGSPGERRSGREMLEDWGVLSENQEGLDAGDALGFGADLLFDPLNLIGGGLLKRGLGMADDAADATKAIGAIDNVPKAGAQLSPEMVNKLDDLAKAKVDPQFGGGSLQINDDPVFKDLYMRSQDWATFDDATKRRLRVPDAMVVAKIEAQKQGQGAYRALHDELAKHGRPIVVESVGNEPFMEKLRHMGYQEIDGGYGTGLGHSYVYPPIAPAERTASSVNPLLAAIVAQNATQAISGY